MGKKSTKIVVQDRIKEITDLYLQGMTYTSIMRHASEQNWGVSERQIDNYIIKATQFLAEINKTSLEEKKALIEYNQWKLYQKSKDDPNFLHIARQLLMDIAKINSIGVVNVSHSLADKRDLRNSNDEEIDYILEVSNETE